MEGGTKPLSVLKKLVFVHDKKQAWNPGTVQKRISNSDGRTDDGRTDGLINIQADMFYNIQKEPLKIRGIIFNNALNHILKKKFCSPMEKGWIEFHISTAGVKFWTKWQC